MLKPIVYTSYVFTLCAVRATKYLSTSPAMQGDLVPVARVDVYRATRLKSVRRILADLIYINPLKSKRRLLYLKTQSVPRCKHFSSRL